MSTHVLSRRLTALTITAIAILGLTACTGSPADDSAASSSSAPSDAGSDAPSDTEGDSGQSVADACTLVQDAITEATAEFDDAEDPSAVVSAMTAASEELASIAPDVTNDQVAAIVPALEDLFGQVATVMQSIVDGDTDKLSDLEALGTEFQQTTAEFQELCAS
jgi:hypothetical protein